MNVSTLKLWVVNLHFSASEVWSYRGRVNLTLWRQRRRCYVQGQIKTNRPVSPFKENHYTVQHSALNQFLWTSKSNLCDTFLISTITQQRGLTLWSWWTWVSDPNAVKKKKNCWEDETETSQWHLCSVEKQLPAAITSQQWEEETSPEWLQFFISDRNTSGPQGQINSSEMLIMRERSVKLRRRAAVRSLWSWWD